MVLVYVKVHFGHILLIRCDMGRNRSIDLKKKVMGVSWKNPKVDADS
jgi:hypothetical protein